MLVEGAAVEDLEAHQVEVHGVGVFGEVDELPDFGGVELRKLGGGLVPVLAVDEHDHGAGRRLSWYSCRVMGAGGDGGGLGDASDGAQETSEWEWA